MLRQPCPLAPLLPSLPLRRTRRPPTPPAARHLHSRHPRRSHKAPSPPPPPSPLERLQKGAERLSTALESVGLPPVYPPPPRHILVERSGAYLALLALVALTTLFVKRLLLSAGRRLLAAYRDLTADSPPPRPPQPAAPVPDSGAERGAEALDAEPALALEGNAERSARQHPWWRRWRHARRSAAPPAGAETKSAASGPRLRGSKQTAHSA